MSRARVLGDGTLIFPQRGPPPKCPDGYDPTNDPYTFKCAWEPCKQRYYIPFTCPNGNQSYRPHCKVNTNPVTFDICEFCSLPEKG